MTGLCESDMGVASGRSLICIHDAARPLSIGELKERIALWYDKAYDLPKLQHAINFLIRRKLIDNELRLLSLGKEVYNLLVANRSSGAERFFRKSESANVVPSATAVAGRASVTPHLPNPGLMVMH